VVIRPVVIGPVVIGPIVRPSRTRYRSVVLRPIVVWTVWTIVIRAVLVRPIHLVRTIFIRPVLNSRTRDVGTVVRSRIGTISRPIRPSVWPIIVRTIGTVLRTVFRRSSRTAWLIVHRVWTTRALRTLLQRLCLSRRRR